MTKERVQDAKKIISITMPGTMVLDLERIVPSGSRSRFVTELVQAALELHANQSAPVIENQTAQS